MNIETTKAELIGIIETMQTQEVLDRIKSEVVRLKEVETSSLEADYTIEEAELIEKAKNAVPQELMQKYDDLYLEFISEDKPDEKKQAQLLKINDQLLHHGTQRLKYTIHLSKLWGISVDDVMQKIDLPYFNQ